MREVKICVDEHGNLFALDRCYIKKLLVDVHGISHFGRVLINEKSQAPKPTNADRIRNMAIGSLAEFLGGDTSSPPGVNCNDCKWDSCVLCWLDWLKEEADG